MESVLKQLPKEAQQTIETVPEIQQVITSESSGITWYQGVGILALVVIVAAAVKKVGCCKKK